MEAKRNFRSRFLLVLLIMVAHLDTYAQQDFILMRDGSSRRVQIDMVSSDMTTFIEEGGNRVSVPNTAIYMIKYNKRGNVFFTEEGNRVSGDDDGKIPNGASAIYLLQGGEITGYRVSINEKSVSYAISKKSSAAINYIPVESVFLILYPDGTKDLINDFETIRQKKEKALEEQRRQEEEARLAEIRARYPKDAVITTKQGTKMTVSLLWENEQTIAYKKTNLKKSPIFCMDRTNIKELIIND